MISEPFLAIFKFRFRNQREEFSLANFLSTYFKRIVYLTTRLEFQVFIASLLIFRTPTQVFLATCDFYQCHAMLVDIPTILR